MRQTKDYLKNRKLSKYILLGEKKIKVFRPKEIVKLSKDGEIYGDVRLLDFEFEQKTIDKYQDSALLVLKSKVKGLKYYFQEVPPKWFDDSRMHRLASAIIFEQTFERDGVQDEKSFMKEGLELEKDLPYEALKEMFLKSKKPKLRIADLNRLIQLWEQESWG